MTEPQVGKSVSHALSAMALKRRLARLSPEKLAALQKRLQQQERSGYEPIHALPSEAVYPLSFHQRRLWFMEQLQSAVPRYNVTRAIRVRGPLKRGALESALQSLVDRHEALRTTFQMLDGEPVQRINASPELPLPVVDLQAVGTNKECAESLLRQRLTAEGRRSFDLSADLMLRTVLYQLAEDEHVLQVTIHHLACDGWSLQLLFNQLAILYRGSCSGRTVELPPTRLRYVDFARWQRKPQQRELFQERVQWWKRQLAGAPPVLELAADRPRPQIESGLGAFCPLEIPSGLLEQLESLGREEGATLYMTLLTGFFILLHRYTGMESFLVGSANAARYRPETHEIVGFFVNTIVLRADLSADLTARQVLLRVRETVIDAVNHADVPFERIVESLDPPRDLSRHPLFQVVFNTPPQYSVELHDLDVSPVNVDPNVSRLDLEMTYSDGANRTTGMTWNTDLFTADTIRMMLRHYCVILQAIAVDPDQLISRLPLLTEMERRQLMVEWNHTAADYPRDMCVHELFEKQVERTPNAVAVIFEDQQLTYRELNARANQLAHYLRGQGVKRQTLVGICMKRSCEMLASLLAVAKSGGAYVPLDPSYPQERLAFILEDSQAAVLLTEENLAEELGRNATTVCADLDGAVIARQSTDNPDPISGPEDLAYVIYTSGSTGKPKGVMIEHRPLVNFLWSMRKRPGLGERDVLLAVTTISFDIAALELYLPLVCGAKVVIASAEESGDGRKLAGLIESYGVTLMQATPATWQMMLEIAWQGCDSLQILCGGEALPRPLADQLLEKGQTVWNLYGPTETTVWSAVQQVVAGEEEVPIGRPIANTQVYVLDRLRQPVPIGVPGELYIGGEGLARGYLNRPELDKERFLTASLEGDAAARLYRTGDLVRYRSDGRIIFLGRTDQQVKVRGFRVESGEIENVLVQHPDIERAVVLAKEFREADKRLVAFVSTHSESEPTVSELRKYLREKLPDYMLPSAFVVMDRYPLTPNGKVDRLALLRTAMPNIEGSNSYQPPQTPMEEFIALIWKEVLGIERVGLHDNFFDLGGHSLLSMKVIVQIEKKLYQTIHPSELFLQTLQQLAASCERRVNAKTRPTRQRIGRQLWQAVKRKVFGSSRRT